MNTPAPKTPTAPDEALSSLMGAALDVPAPAEPPEVPAWATSDPQEITQPLAPATGYAINIPKNADGLPDAGGTINVIDVLASSAGLPTWTRLQYILRLKGERAKALERDAARYRWLCDKFGITKLPCAIERIIEGSYVPDGKAAIDAAIDTAIAAQQGKGGTR